MENTFEQKGRVGIILEKLNSYLKHMHIISNRELGEVFEQKDAIIIKDSQNRYQFYRIVYHAMRQVGLGWVWSTPGGCSLALCKSPT